MQKSVHYLRILWTVSCAIACVLLIALWVRSYVRSDQISGPISKTKRLFVCSLAGAVQCRLDDRPWSNPNSFRPWNIDTQSVADFQKMADDLDKARAGLGSPLEKVRIDFTRKVGWSGGTMFLPYWLLILLTAPLLVIPWLRQLRWRFSLRTLLIATTLIAVVLGLIVYAAPSH